MLRKLEEFVENNFANQQQYFLKPTTDLAV
jgi:hypothetical protein